MGKTQIAQAPEVKSLPRAGKWEQEKQAFLHMRDSLPKKYQNKYVAIHEGKIVESGHEKIAVGLRAYSRYGYVPIYIGYTGDDLDEIVRAPSPRIGKRKE